MPVSGATAPALPIAGGIDVLGALLERFREALHAEARAGSGFIAVGLTPPRDPDEPAHFRAAQPEENLRIL